MQQYFQKMQNRCQISPDTRPLKRQSQQRRGESRQSGGADKNSLSSTVLFPDVYPQQEKQEEDNLQPERLNRGYQIEVVHSSLVRHEYDSLIKSSRVFMSDDQLYRTARWIKQLMQKKSELNAILLDKNWIKDNTVRNFSDGFRVEFFESLISGRRIQKDNKRHSLATCFPRFLRTTYDQLTLLAQQKLVPLCEAMNLLYDKGVPIQKAIWFLKMNQIAHPILVTYSKQKKGTSVSNDDYASDMRQFFIRYLRCLLKEYDKAIPGQLEQNLYYQRWPYIAALIKHSFEDGMLDRHEFLLDMCELLAEFSNFSIEQPQTFRILIILMTQFTDLITQNVFIARRVAYILCNRLAQYKRDYEKMRSTTQISPNSTSSTNYCFIEDLINCQHHRPTLLNIFGFLHSIIVDCPAALIWIPFESAELLEGSQKSSKQLRAVEKENAIQSVSWICGSPLDHLPCSIELTTTHLALPVKDKINKILEKRIREIMERSSFIESHWAYINPSSDQSGIESIVENCLDILSMLDTIPLDQSKAIRILFDNIFPNENDESISTNSSQMSIDIRVRMLINWAVTYEREGTHRALIVTKLLKMLSENPDRFGTCVKTIHELLVTCLNLDWSNLFKNVKNDKNCSVTRANMEFANLMLLFYELQRFSLFNHDQYVRTINGAFYQQSLYQRLKQMKIQNPIEQLLQKSTKVQEQVPTKPPESQMIISFIPTTPSISSSAHSSNLQQQKPEDFAKLMDDTFLDNHAFMESSIELSFHERFLLHLPVEQREANRDICNQRSIMLYGISELREQAKQELRKLARDICKIWKKMSVEILHQSPSSPVRELRFRHRCTNEQIVDVMNRFQSQTYYDQLVITGWCAESFMDLIEEFLRCLQIQTNEKSTQILPAFPTYECLDILCEIMNLCMNIHSLITFTAELLPFLIEIEEILHRRSHDFYINYIPGSLTAQLAYVLISQLAVHFNYFLYSPEACSIFNNLYLLIKHELHTTSMESNEPLILTGWTRGIAVFILHGRDKLLSAELNIREGGNFTPIFEAFDELLALLPANGIGSLSHNLNYKNFPLIDQFNSHQLTLHHLRFFPFDKMKICLQSMQNEHSKYSFVQDSFKAACRCGHDYERLVELANFCAHISCQLRMETEWCNAIQELCCSNVSSNNSNWNEMLLDVDSNNFSTHYPLSTFVLLLASKYAISSHALIDRLISNVFKAVIREEGGLSNDNFEHGICLAIYICASLICGTDIPFNCTEITPRWDANQRKDCNQNAIRIAHIAELGSIIFPLLTVILQFVDELKRKVDASKKDPKALRNFSQQMAISRCALLSMCEQEWVIQQMFEFADQEMDSFINSTRLKKHSLGEQLLRISLRRKSERLVKQELMECTDKTIFDKLLSTLNIWNMRATYFDFKLKINQNFPESPGNLINSYYHETMFVLNNIANAVHQLFLSRLASKECFDEQENISAKNFRPSSINCFWLIAPLFNAMPTLPPPNLIQTNSPIWCSWQTSAMKAYFLKIVCENLKTMPEINKEGKNKSQISNEQLKYEQLFAYLPFLNLVMACTEGENVKQLLDTLLDFVDDIVTRVRKNPIIPHQSAFLSEREGLILRLNLLTGLFDHLATNANAEQWASILYQLLLFEVLTSDNDTDYFDTCLDMLIILCHKMYPHRTYATFASKFKNLRIPDDLYCLQQLLPIPKSQAELTAWDYFFNSTGKTVPPQANIGGKGSLSTTNVQQSQPQNQPNLQITKSPPKGLIPGVIVDKQFESVEKKILRMLKHDHWIQKNTDLNGKMSLSFIERPGLPGEDKIRPDPFLSPPEMEQVPIIQEIGEEQKSTQEMDKQEQKYPHQTSQQRQQIPPQHSILEQQNPQQMRAFHHQQPLQQQQSIPVTGQQQSAQQHHQQFQQMLQHQQQQMMTAGGHSIAGMTGEPIPSTSAGLLGGGQIPPQFSAQSSFLNLAAHGSGTSTPIASDSPVRPAGAGRGGRRKSQAGSNQTAGTTTGAGRSQKRRKEAAKHQASQMMGGEMFSAANPNNNGKATGIMGGTGPPGGQPPQQMSMGPQSMMQHIQAQMQWQQQQQMQRQQQQQATTQQQMTMGRAPPLMFNQPQPISQQPSQQFRQQPQPPSQYQPSQQHQPVPGRPTAPQFGAQQHQMPPQMAMGMMGGPGGQPMAGIGTQQPQQMSDFKKQLHGKLMQKQQNKQAQQQQQQQHPAGMGNMGMMPPGP